MSFTVLILSLSVAAWVILAGLILQLDRPGPAAHLYAARVAATPRSFQRATANTRSGRGTPGLSLTSPHENGRDNAGRLDGFSAADTRPMWMKLGFGTRPPEPPVVGRAAQVRWWERVRSAIGLSLMIVLLAVLFLAALGALALGAGFFLEKVV